MMAVPHTVPQGSFAQSRSLAPLNGDIAPGDLGDYLAVVLESLRSLARDAAEGHRRSGHWQSDSDEANALFAGLRECASALGLIHATVVDEAGRRNALERELADTQAALAQALADLAGTAAGERHDLHLAHHDGLTALPNRAYFLEKLDDALNRRPARRQALAVLCIDLDGFKEFNARHGKQTGDELLRIVGIRLSRAVRADDVLCRLGGDQFACLLADIHARAQLAALAGKLAEAIAAPLQIGKRNLRVQAAIGIAVSPGHGVNAAALMHNACSAMQRARDGATAFAFFAYPLDTAAG